MRRRKWAGAVARAAVAAVLGGALVAGGATAAFAGTEPDADRVVIDAGNGHKVVVDPDTRRFQMTTPTPLVWDSLLYGHFYEFHSYEWGDGWGYGNAAVSQWRGETKFLIPFLGVFDYDESAEPTHLRGYPADDVVATLDQGELPPRGDDVPAGWYAFTLHHRDTGVTDYFNHYGQLLSSIDALGGRTDWVSHDEGTKRLRRIVHADGSMTLVDQVSDDRFRITGPDDVMTFVGLRRTLIDEISTSRGDTIYEYNTPSGHGPLSRILSRHPATGARTLIEIEWDDFMDGTIRRVERNDEVVFPVP